MKHLSKPLLLLCSLTFFFASCAGDPETHQLMPVTGGSVLFADQTADSVLFYTFDSWTVTSQADWLRIEGDSHADIKYDYTKRYLCRVDVSVLPNTTGHTRQGLVQVRSYDYSYSVPFYQFGMLDVTRPAYTVESYLDEAALLPDVALHVLTDSANWEADSISFYVHNQWELTFADGAASDWLVLDKNTGRAGKNQVNLTLTPNTDTENGRETVLVLTSGEVSDRITVRQLPAKKTE
ncbi:MAG: BACON domain-containing protein [Bacteroidaceae bacterium]|nr:BACON domain-containing protein [Bacteroidaceae bacterium]